MKKTEVPRFVKWAGGKLQLIEQFKPFFPKEIKRYFEPFVGSGAVAFYVIQKYQPKETVLSDINDELITAFNAIKTDAEQLINKLKEHKKKHLKQSKEYYYQIRQMDPAKLTKLEKAARFIYLNKTCFNGLYRVNSKGQFNVPMGSYKNPDIIQADKLRLISKLLKKVKTKKMSFEKVIKLAKKGDFIYFDPPYYPLKKGKSFTTYTKNKFLENEQKELANIFRILDKKGCKVMLSNSDTAFIKKLYKKYNIHIVKASRPINSNGSNRGKINEVVITNY
ncbi:DNA adenine methylase [Candidatus Woesearchaeota archaeon]|nr:DNA adenine methylase [Candidatus Woesearchaeota archaeon]MBW3005845.1 DNA adenine methylase [Candidatus Woesearchaeota archaeon]